MVPSLLHSKSSSIRMARGPQELQNSSRRRRQEQQAPHPRPHLWGSANKKGGLALSTPAESPDPMEGGC